jgi:RNA polymerase sigma-70 factor (ECF subfamily)
MVSSLVAKEAISCDGDVHSLAGEVECADSDFALVDRIRANDALAFDELVDKYRVRLFSVIYNMTSNKDDAFDLMQDVFIKVYRNIGKFNKKSSFFSWLYRIAVNTVITHINKSRLKRFFNLEGLDEDGVKDFCIDGLVERNDARRDIFLKELHENLNIALQKLSNKHRVVVVLCEIEGLSSSEAAEILKCSEGTVRSRLHYAKEQLKGYLNKYLG